MIVLSEMSVIEKTINVSNTDTQRIREKTITWLGKIKATIVENQPNYIRATHEKLYSIDREYKWGHWNPKYWKKEIIVQIQETEPMTKIVFIIERPRSFQKSSKIHERWYTYLFLDYLNYCSLEDNEVKEFFTDKVKTEMIRDIVFSSIIFIPLFSIFIGLVLVLIQGVNSLGLIFLSLSLIFIVPMSAEMTNIRKL